MEERRSTFPDNDAGAERTSSPSASHRSPLPTRHGAAHKCPKSGCHSWENRYVSQGEADKPTPIRHRAPTVTTVKQLYATAFRCGFVPCTEPLYRMKDDGEFILNSTVAHICARSEGGPRWNPEMPEDDNRSPTNLIPMCQKHSTEIDVKPWKPVDLLLEWKAAQIADFQKRQKNWPLTDEEAEEVVQVSFSLEELGVSFATATTIMAVGKAVGVLIETARNQRHIPRAAAKAWLDMRFRVQQSVLGVWDSATGKQIDVEPSPIETAQYQQDLDAALGEVASALEPQVTSLIGELHAASHALPELASWCDWIEIEARKVLAASSRWPGIPPVDDDQRLLYAIDELRRASSALSARWQGKEAEEPPLMPLPPSEPMATDAQIAVDKHEELLKAARPWSRVDGLPYDPEMYRALTEAAQVAITLPFVFSFIPLELGETARLAARVAQNADDEVFETLIEEAVILEPLGIACHLLRELMFVARDKQRLSLGKRAEDKAVHLLQTADWTSPQVWMDNRFHVRNLMGWAASTTDDATIHSQITDALAAHPILLQPIVYGISTQLENRDPNDSRRLIGITVHIREVPPWFPTEAVASEIRRQYPDILPSKEHCELEAANEFPILAAQLLYLEATP